MSNQEVIIDSYYRSYDEDNERWIRHAFWTKASQVECADGTDVETKITEEIDAKIQELEQSFQGGCSVIADAITGGRDGNGTGGVPTATDASLQTMSDNITALALNNYNDGIAYADNRVNTNSASYHAGGNISTQTYTLRASEEHPTRLIDTIECKPGYTLWQNMIPVVTSHSYWTWNDQSSYGADATNFNWSQSGNVLTFNGYRTTAVSVTIYYIGGTNVTYSLYAITLSGACHNKSQWEDSEGYHAEVGATVNGKIYVKIDGTTVSIYSNTAKVKAGSYGNWEGHVVPLSATIDNVSMTNQSNGSFRINVSGHGSSGNSTYGTTSNVSATIECLISNGAISVAPNGTLTAHANLGNLDATGSINATAYKMI